MDARRCADLIKLIKICSKSQICSSRLLQILISFILSDVAIDIAGHLVAGAVPHVFVLGRLVPQLRLAAA